MITTVLKRAGEMAQASINETIAVPSWIFKYALGPMLAGLIVAILMTWSQTGQNTKDIGEIKGVTLPALADRVKTLEQTTARMDALSARIDGTNTRLDDEIRRLDDTNRLLQQSIDARRGGR